MTLAGMLRARQRASSADRRLAAECALALIGARLTTLLPARFYSRFIEETAPPAGSGDVERVAAMLARVSARMPFRCRCLEDAIALQRMLARRGVEAAICLGVSLERADRVRPSEGRAAHAWVEVGGRIVTGGEGRERYAEVARL